MDFDVLIIGSGAAGLTLALNLPTTKKIAIVCKGELLDGSSSKAQGGIAGVLDEQDSFEKHIEDTLNAGAGLCDKRAVKFAVRNGTDALKWLIEQSVPFSLEGKQLHLTKEGGHSHRRIIHAADATGYAISSTLIGKVKQKTNITLLEYHSAVDLITTRKLDLPGNRCIGAYLYDIKKESVDTCRAHHVVLATGGASKVYLYTSNPDGASGDGIAMAWRAGCRVANMEFNQFHPTCLYHSKAKAFLITEAIRGEGGHLTLPNGKRFMHKYDERKELAPRDIVARAIDNEMKRKGLDHVFLDISHKPAEFVKEHFPTIYQKCLKYGIDITKEPIPVVPAAHYTCGGIMTDLNGKTDISGLFAIGECTYTGLHGANRLASNSLLECVVFGRSVATTIINSFVHDEFDDVPLWDESLVTDSDENVVISHNWDEVRRFMWDYVGIVRTDKRLIRAQHRIKLLQDEIQDFYSNFKISNDLLELRNLVQVADLMIESALKRKESRGLHYTLDYPETNEKAKITVLRPN
ncbi:MAG: L-aspartate oxidase [Saccharospirillaceae bacterium]|nr:L-aspartate oxidase [Pseudomonadales bacterium]NRB78293.1 L-aspartate oxidase [Saccharospirillaceae bacterium]